MKNEKLMHAIGKIDDDLIYHAVNDVKVRKRSVRCRWAAAAACLCLIAVTVISVSIWHIPADHHYANSDHRSSYPSGYDPSSGVPATDNTEIGEHDTSPVYYSSLMFPTAELNEDLSGFSESSMMDIKAFDESALSQDHCCMIIEGTVVNLYSKRYNYDIYSDKFEENGILHAITDTVVYEVAVDKTWYGEDIGGKTILIEDTSYFTEPVLAVKKGRRYVLPLYEYGDSVWTLGREYAGGDITRETRYSTVYPYHPQIAVTDDGSYVISKDWKTLTAVNARDIIMDTPAGEDTDYQDKMCLVDADTFTRQMSVLVSNMGSAMKKMPKKTGSGLHHFFLTARFSMF